MDNNLSNKLDSNNDIYSPQKQETVDNANSTTTYTQNINTPQGDSYALYSKSENYNQFTPSDPNTNPQGNDNQINFESMKEETLDDSDEKCEKKSLLVISFINALFIGIDIMLCILLDYGDAIIFYIIDDSLILITIIIFVLDFILFYLCKKNIINTAVVIFILIQFITAIFTRGMGYTCYEKKIDGSAFIVTLIIRLLLMMVTSGIGSINISKKVVSTDITTPVLPPSNI